MLYQLSYTPARERSYQIPAYGKRRAPVWEVRLGGAGMGRQATARGATRDARHSWAIGEVESCPAAVTLKSLEHLPFLLLASPHGRQVRRTVH